MCSYIYGIIFFPRPGELAQARWLAKLLAQRAHFRVRMLSTRSQLQEVAETGGYPGNPARISITDFNIFVISHKWQEGNGTAGPMEDAGNKIWSSGVR